MSIETSELLEEFIDAITQGQPSDSDWVSIDENARRRQAYYDRLAIVRAELDRRIPASSPTGE